MRMCWSLWMRIACLSLALVQATQAAPAPVVKMRQHGYQLGDVLTQTVEIQLRSGQQLDTQHLPLPGPVKPWLDLRRVSTQTSPHGLVLQLQWQVFATVETAQPLPLPAFQLRLLGNPAETVQVPALMFYQSPVLGGQVQDVQRMPSHPPLLYALSGWQWLAAIALALSVLCALMALWLRDALPWWPWQPGPLLRVQRACRAYPVINPNKALYQALCQTAGCVLHVDNLARLYLRAPWLHVLQTDINRFVAAYLQQQYAYRPLQATTDTYALLDDGWLAQAVLLERLSLKRKRAQA